jgi:hypothetical protein
MKLHQLVTSWVSVNIERNVRATVLRVSSDIGIWLEQHALLCTYVAPCQLDTLQRIIVNLSTLHCLRPKQHLLAPPGNQVPELRGLHGLLKIRLWIKKVPKLKYQSLGTSSVEFEAFHSCEWLWTLLLRRILLSGCTASCPSETWSSSALEHISCALISHYHNLWALEKGKAIPVKATEAYRVVGHQAYHIF